MSGTADLRITLPADAPREMVRDLLLYFGTEMGADEMDLSNSVEVSLTVHETTPEQAEALRRGFAELFPGVTFQTEDPTPLQGMTRMHMVNGVEVVTEVPDADLPEDPDATA